jgi:hypothetical protein
MEERKRENNHKKSSIREQLEKLEAEKNRLAQERMASLEKLDKAK